MSYQLETDGAFRLTPAASEEQRARVAAENRGWRVSPNGMLFYLPDEEHPDAFAAISHFVEKLLPQMGLAIEGQVEWRGEDGASGQIRVANGVVEIIEPEPGRLADDEVQRLLGSLLNGEEVAQLEAIEILSYFQLVSPGVLSGYAGALAFGSLNVGLAAANALTGCGPKALPVLPALTTALTDPEPWVQAAAAEAIGAIGPLAASALPALRSLLAHPSYGPAGRAKEAIAKVDM